MFLGGRSTSEPMKELVARVKGRDDGAAQELVRRVLPGVKFLIARQVGSAAEDLVQQTVLYIFDTIRSGSLRSPETLPQFAQVVAQRQVVRYLKRLSTARTRFVDRDCSDIPIASGHDAEAELLLKERKRCALTVLSGLSVRHREVLSRFYLMEESEAQICLDMNLTVAQFRLLKSRAKKRVGLLARSSSLLCGSAGDGTRGLRSPQRACVVAEACDERTQRAKKPRRREGQRGDY